MNATIHLSSLLDSRRFEVLERWLQRIHWEHADKELSRGELRDHLPLLFDQLLSALRGLEGSGPGSENGKASVAHGTQRLRVGFDLGEVIREYEILAECILEEVEALGASISIRHFKRVLQLLNAGRADAVSAYVDRRDKELANASSQHVAFVAHELRGPLMATLMAVATLQKSSRPEDEKTLGLLTRNLTTVRDLVDQVLVADRLTGRVQLTREPLDLCELIRQMVAETQLTAEHRQVEINLNAPDALRYNGDRRLLYSAISNVLGNAIKFTHEGSSINITARQSGEAITVEIEDSCGGLPDGNATDLFKPFVQRGEDRTGFGLGLAIVKQAVEAHGGRVSVRNLPAKGCAFTIELPLAPKTSPDR